DPAASDTRRSPMPINTHHLVLHFRWMRPMPVLRLRLFDLIDQSALFGHYLIRALPPLLFLRLTLFPPAVTGSGHPPCFPRLRSPIVPRHDAAPADPSPLQDNQGAIGDTPDAVLDVSQVEARVRVRLGL